jgi:hypothetical protein
MLAEQHTQPSDDFYGDLNLNDHVDDAANVRSPTPRVPAGAYTYDFFNTARGGDQRIFTAGLNWYHANVVRFAVNYELIQIRKLQSSSSPNR